MIKSRKELKFFIMADMMMNRGKFSWSLLDRIKHLILPDYIMLYLKSLRYCQYFADRKNIILPHLYPLIVFHQIRFRKLGIKLGYSIGCQTLGYGPVLCHYGTIVIGPSNRLGNYAVLHTSICVTNNGKIIGDACHISTGVKITSKLTLGDNVSIAANSVVNKSFESNCLIAGAPAIMKKEEKAWYERDGEPYSSRVERIEQLKKDMNL